jgi:hypothetical protein
MMILNWKQTRKGRNFLARMQVMQLWGKGLSIVKFAKVTSGGYKNRGFWQVGRTHALNSLNELRA